MLGITGGYQCERKSDSERRMLESGPDGDEDPDAREVLSPATSQL